MNRDDQEDQTIREKYGSSLKHMRNADSIRCPDADRLIDFHENRLAGKSLDEAENHVIACPFCLDALEALRRQAEAAGNSDQVPENWETNNRSLRERFHASLRAFPPPCVRKVG